MAVSTIEFRPVAEVWKRRGNPGRDVPEHIQAIAEQTYNSNVAGVLAINHEELDEINEFRRLLASYARKRGLKMRFQPVGVLTAEHDVFKFQMVDRTPRKATA